MLTELRVRDFAIIDSLDLTFDSGLIIFTGETGAGKSIIIDAVGMLLGGRADTTMIRTGTDQALIEGTFKVSPAAQELILPILEQEAMVDDDPETLTLGREFRREGRSVARVNGRAVSLRLLRELGDHLVDVHGQSEHLSLLRVRHHLELLDRFAGDNDLLREYRETYRSVQAVRRDLESLRQSEREAARRMDLLTYQIQEIEGARLKTDEEGDLRDERNRLANADNLATLTQEALVTLEDSTVDTPAAVDLIGQSYAALAAIAKTDPSQEALRDRAQQILDELGELASDLRTYVEALEVNPKRLTWVEDRLDLIYNLKRKYGDTVADVLSFAERAREELDAITHAEERIALLEEQEASLMVKLGDVGEELSAARREAAEKLAQAVEKELDDLRMEQARFQVEFRRKPDPDGVLLPNGERVAFDAAGLDQVEFLVAPNPGEGLKPLVKIASGGETSRLMLALKNVLARADQMPTLIFDEIDQGIGGRVGFTVGEKLRSLSSTHQVLCITHLPQLAAFGEQHYHVEKELRSGRTITLVQPLSGDDRINELAGMMGDIGDGTLQSAREILDAAAKKMASPQK